MLGSRAVLRRHAGGAVGAVLADQVGIDADLLAERAGQRRVALAGRRAGELGVVGGGVVIAAAAGREQQGRTGGEGEGGDREWLCAWPPS